MFKANASAAVGSAIPPPHWLERGKTSRRTSLVIDPPDGRIPPTVAGRGRGRGAAVGVRRQHVQRSTGSEPVGALHHPRRARAIFRPSTTRTSGIVQGPGVVAITYEMIHDTRVIPDSTAGAPWRGDSRLHGDSRGRWEGDTLVVDTTNFSAAIELPRIGRATLHLDERFTRATGRAALRGDRGRSADVDEAVDGGAHAQSRSLRVRYSSTRVTKATTRCAIS